MAPKKSFRKAYVGIVMDMALACSKLSNRAMLWIRYCAMRSSRYGCAKRNGYQWANHPESRAISDFTGAQCAKKTAQFAEFRPGNAGVVNAQCAIFGSAQIGTHAETGVITWTDLDGLKSPNCSKPLHVKGCRAILNNHRPEN